MPGQAFFHRANLFLQSPLSAVLVSRLASKPTTSRQPAWTSSAS